MSRFTRSVVAYLALGMGVVPLFAQTPLEEANALLAAKNPAAALTKLEAVPADSAWFFKARFLKARLLTDQKQHEAAAQIYADEAARLFALTRKDSLAKVLTDFADELAKEPGAQEAEAVKPNYAAALSLYQRALGADLSPTMREAVQWKLITAARAGNLHQQALTSLQSYLGTYDSDWMLQAQGQTIPKPPVEGSHRYTARVQLVETLKALGNQEAAKRNVEHILRLAKGEDAQSKEIAGDAAWLKILLRDPRRQPQQQQSPAQVQQPNPPGAQGDKGPQGEAGPKGDRADYEPWTPLSAYRNFLKNYPSHRHAPEAAREVARILTEDGKPDAALTAWQAFIDGKVYQFTENEATLKPDPKTGKSAVDQLNLWKQEAVFAIGQLLLNQRKHPEAIAQFQKYVTQFPNGSQWAAAQSAIIDAEFQLGLQAVSVNDEKLAHERFDAFLTKYPLDARAPQILFIYGQFPYAEALHQEADKVPAAQLAPLFQRAIDTWGRLLSKYPKSEQASMALYNTAVIQAEKFGKLDEALVTFKRTTWGKWSSLASARAQVLSERSLTLATERSYRTAEKVTIKAAVRNIEKLHFSQYALNLEAYFRKQHKLEGLDLLDLDLIEPDKTWDTPVAAYAKYKGLEQSIEVPFADGKPGVCVVRADGEDWQAATLVIRSDLDIIVHAAAHEVLVFVVDRAKNTGVADAEVLVSDGTKIIATGKSGPDGVYRHVLDKDFAAEQLGIFAKAPQGVAVQNLSVSGLGCTGELKPRAAIYTEKTAYLPGQTLHYHMKLREPVAGKYQAPAAKKLRLWVLGLEGRLLQEQLVTLDKFGMVSGEFAIPETAPVGSYKLRFEDADKPETGRYEAPFNIINPKPETIRLMVRFAKPWVLRGEKISGTISATDTWGDPLRDEPLQLALPDGRVLRQKTNQAGLLEFNFDPAGFDIEATLKFTATLVNRGVTKARSVAVTEQPYRIGVNQDTATIIAGVPFELNLFTVTPDSKPVATELKIELLKTPEAPSHRVLEGVPWISYQPVESPPQVVQTLTVKTTEAKGGIAQALTLADPGTYLLRITGQDDLGKPITTEESLQALGPKDATKLAFVSGARKTPANGIAKVNLHSRLASSLALLTVQGAHFLSHKIIALQAGMNPLEVAVGNEFAAVQISVSMLDGTAHQFAQTPVLVDHALKLTMAKAADGTEKLTVLDASGKPVEAQLQESWIHESQSEGITIIQENSDQLNPRIAVATSSAFSHQATPKKIDREAADQKDRFVAVKSDQQRILEAQSVELQLNPTNKLLEQAYTSNYANNGFLVNNGGVAFPVTPTTPQQFGLQQQVTLPDLQMITEFPYPTDFDPPQIPQNFGGAAQGASPSFLDPLWRDHEDDSQPAAARIARQHYFQSGPMANSAPSVPYLRHTTRAFTTGLEEGVLVTLSDTKPVAEPIKLPPTANQAGDKATPLQRTDRATYEAMKAAEATPTEPWGLATAMYAGGVLAAGDTDLKIIVPAERNAVVQFQSSEHVPDFLAQLNNRSGVAPGNALLTALAALRSGMDEARGKALARLLVANLAATQKDGGWPWQGIPSLAADTLTSSTAYWALIEAKQAGIHVSDKLLDRAEKALVSGYTGIPADDNEKKAVVLHALSVGGKADFSNCNRLYREREALSETALAFMAATFVRMDRPEMARDLLTLLAKKAVGTKSLDGKDLTQWQGSVKVSRLSEPELATALALWTYAKLDKANPLAQQSAAYLLHSPAVAAITTHRNTGPVAAALAEYFAGTVAAAHAPFTVLQSEQQQTGNITLATGEHHLILRNPTAGNLYRATITLIDSKWTDPRSLGKLELVAHDYLHEAYQYKDKPLKAGSNSPVSKAEFGQRITVNLKFNNGGTTYPGFIVLEETLPAGCYYVPGSVTGNFSWATQAGNKLYLMYPPGTLEAASYQMAAMVPGEYQVAPTILRDAHKPNERRVSKPGKLTILAPGIKSDEPYQLSHQEHFELANLKFADGLYEDALPHLETLFKNEKHRELYERDLARMTLWVLASRPQPDAKRLVDVFELLSERHPDLVVPFDKILVVADAYRKLGEFERGSMAYAAAIDGGFVSDAGLSSVLEAVDFLGSIEFQERLWQEHPDGEDEIGALFALAQTLVNKAPEAEKLAVRRGQAKLEKTQLLKRSRDLIQQFIRLYPTDANADDAAFSLTNVYFALKDYPLVVSAAEAGAKTHPTSPFQNSFQYMAALGHFWQFHYDQALASAAPVANGETKDRDYARYITAQIHHAQGKAADAIAWYEKVSALYPDAKSALSYFQDREITLPEITSYKPGEAIKLKVDYRNLKEVSLQIYKVDLMRLYLREKNLSNITAVNLAGIEPQSELTTKLGEGKDYDTMQQKEIELPMKEDGAYLVIARGEDHFTSGLVLVTPLKLDIQEQPGEGSLRVNVKNTVKGGFVADAEVKAIGSNSNKPIEGNTDPRGLFEANNLTGNPTVIVRTKAGQYAFFRGDKDYQGAGKSAPTAAPVRGRMILPSKEEYLKNVEDDNTKVMKGNIDAWSEKKAKAGKGVQLDRVLKK